MARAPLGVSRQFATYVVGGGLCALIDVGVMQLLLRQGVHLAAATTTGFLAGLAVNYAFHSQITFQSSATSGSFVRYMCVVGLNYLITLACVALAASLTGMPLPGKVIALALVALNGYFLGKHWIFK